jgi:hypothetical protein
MPGAILLSQRMGRALGGRRYVGKQRPVQVLFGEYRPDLGDADTSVSIKNCIPVGKGKKASYAQQEALGIVSGSSALTARCQGAAGLADAATLHGYHFSGDKTKLYELIGGTQTDRSGATYACGSAEHWSFVRYGTYVLASNISDAVQSKTIGSTDNFADHFTSTLKPKTRNLAISKNFLFTANNKEGGTEFPNRIRWGAVGNSLSQDADADTQADAQDLENGGEIQALVGRNYVTVFMEKSIQRGSYVGDPVVWRFDEVEKDRGLLAPRALASWGFWDFYLAEDGFHIFNGVRSAPISEGKVTRTFFTELDAQAKHRITMAIRPKENLLYVSYPTNSASYENPDRMLIFHWPSGRWTYADITCELIFTDGSRGYTMEELSAAWGTDLDDTSVYVHSLDSRVYSGGRAQFSAFDTNHKYNDFSGSALTAQLDTLDVEMGGGRLFLPSKARPMVDGGTTTVSVGHRLRPADSNVFGSAVSQNANGDHDLRGQALEDRIHRYRLSISGGFNDASGVTIEGQPTGWQQ